jgi:hypothetical protein
MLPSWKRTTSTAARSTCLQTASRSPRYSSVSSHRNASRRWGRRLLRPAVAANGRAVHAEAAARRTSPVRGLGAERQLPDQIGDRGAKAGRRRLTVVVGDVGRKARDRSFNRGDGSPEPRAPGVGNGIARTVTIHGSERGVHPFVSSSGSSSSAVSSSDNAEVTYAHIEKTGPHDPMFDATVQPPGAFMTPWRLRRRGASGSPTNPPFAGRRRKESGEEPWHELRSKIVSSA